MTHTSRTAASLFFALLLWVPMSAALAMASNRMTQGPAQHVNVKALKTTDDTPPQIKKAATHFSNGAAHLRRQVEAQRKAETGQ